MARHYSTRSFFRQIPNALLARYFERQGVLAGLDWSAIKETESRRVVRGVAGVAGRAAQHDGCRVCGNL